MQSIFQQLSRLRISEAFAIISLALGLIASLIGYGLIRAVLIADPHLERPKELVQVYGWHQQKQQYLEISYPDFQDLRNQQLGKRDREAEMAAFLRVPLVVKIHGLAVPVAGELVSDNYFEALHVHPDLGTLFISKRAAGRPASAVISFELWKSKLGKNRSIIGSEISINDTRVVIMGVVPPSFHGTVLDWGPSPQVWITPDIGPGLPWLSEVLGDRSARMFLIAGRMAPQESLSTMQAWLKVAARNLADTYAVDRDTTLIALPLSESRFWPAERPKVWRSLGTVLLGSLVLLALGTLNAGALIWAKCCTDAQQFAIRFALGASRLSIYGLLWRGALLLTLPGVIAAIAATPLATALFSSLVSPFGVPVRIELPLDLLQVLVAVVVACAVAALIAVTPALAVTQFWDLLSLRSQHFPQSRTNQLLRQAILMLQAGLSTVLLATAALGAANLSNVSSMPLGFSPDGLFIVRLQAPDGPHAAVMTDSSLMQLTNEFTHESEITNASLCRLPPLDPSHMNMRFEVTAGERSKWITANINFAGPGYLTTLGVSLISGREFVAADATANPAPVLLNATLANQLFGATNPVGRTIRLSSVSASPSAAATVATVIGVAPTIKYSALSEPATPYAYLPFKSTIASDFAILVRGPIPLASLHALTERTWRAYEPAAIITGTTPMSEQIHLRTMPERTFALIGILLSIAAGLVAATGIFSATSRYVAEHIRELGIRLAVGAPAGTVQLLVLRRTLTFFIAGVLPALVLLFAARGFLTELLPHAPQFVATVVTVSAAQILLGALAAWVPAHRVAFLNPVDLLRYE